MELLQWHKLYKLGEDDSKYVIFPETVPSKKCADEWEVSQQAEHLCYNQITKTMIPVCI